jgi:acylphosphatase
MAPKLLRTDKVLSPLGVEARLRWYDDGSVRISLEGTPWAIVEAFMPKSNSSAQATLRLRPVENHQIP